MPIEFIRRRPATPDPEMSIRNSFRVAAWWLERFEDRLRRRLQWTLGSHHALQINQPDECSKDADREYGFTAWIEKEEVTLWSEGRSGVACRTTRPVIKLIVHDHENVARLSINETRALAAWLNARVKEHQDPLSVRVWHRIRGYGHVLPTRPTHQENEAGEYVPIAKPTP